MVSLVKQLSTNYPAKKNLLKDGSLFQFDLSDAEKLPKGVCSNDHVYVSAQVVFWIGKLILLNELIGTFSMILSMMTLLRVGLDRLHILLRIFLPESNEKIIHRLQLLRNRKRLKATREWTYVDPFLSVFNLNVYPILPVSQNRIH